MSLEEALALADQDGLDLVEVAPNQTPPVCRLLDYGRFKFIQAKKLKEARRASKGATQQRDVRMAPRIAEHDIQSKIRTVRSLLDEGAKVRVYVRFRGREQTHPEVAMRVLRKVAEGVKDVAKLERAPMMEARALSILLSPALPPGQQKKQQQAEQEKVVAGAEGAAAQEGGG